jgi:hypothetical protein
VFLKMGKKGFSTSGLVQQWTGSNGLVSGWLVVARIGATTCPPSAAARSQLLKSGVAFGRSVSQILASPVPFETAGWISVLSRDCLVELRLERPSHAESDL